MTKTYIVTPDTDMADVRKVTCNTLEECAETARIFFLTPCQIVSDDGQEHAAVKKSGDIKNIFTEIEA